MPADLRVLPGLAGPPDRQDVEAERDALVAQLAPALERLYLWLKGGELPDDERLALLRQVERQSADLSAVRLALSALPPEAACDDCGAPDGSHHRACAHHPETAAELAELRGHNRHEEAL